MAAGRRALAFGLLVHAVTVCGCAGPSLPSPEDAAEEVVRLLRAGDIVTASGYIEGARRLYPDDGALLALAASTADLLWRESDAIADLRALIATSDRAGWSLEMALGRLGDQLFTAGRYGESLTPLRSGAVGEEAVRRSAMAAAAQVLPFRRRQAGPLATEQKLLDGELTEFVCTIGRLRRPFAIDTGSAMTTISRSLAGVASMRAVNDAGTIPDGTGRAVPVEMGVMDAFSVGDVWLGSVPVLVVEDRRLAMRDLFGGPEIAPQGVLGLDLLSMFRMTLDPERGSVILELPRGLPESDSVQCVRANGRCLLPVVIEGQRMWFVLDTGASHSSLTDAGLQMLAGGGRRAVPGFRRVRTAGGGTVSVREVRGLALRVSTARFPGVDLPVVERSKEGLFPVHGVLGVDLLHRCRVTLDGGRVRIQV
jgi:hypothetical protein